MNAFNSSNKSLDLLALSLVWLVLSWFSTTLGDFPLNDDWSMGLPVLKFMSRGIFEPTGFTAMPLLTNVIWGALFCLPEGFSFGALRLSSLTLGLFGVLGIYVLIFEVSQSRVLSLLAALTLTLSPLYFLLSNTFMTDVPFTVMCILSSVFYVKALKSDSKWTILLATCLAMAATLSRQLGLFLPVAFGLSYVFTRKLTFGSVVASVLPFVLCFLSLHAFNEWLIFKGLISNTYRHASGLEFLNTLSIPDGWLFMVNNAYVGLLYLGVFTLPFTLFTFVSHVGDGDKVNKALILSVFLFFELAFWVRIFLSEESFMPLSGNVINSSGFGPVLLNDVHMLALNQPASLSHGIWVAVTAASLIGAAIIVISVVNLAYAQYVAWRTAGSLVDISVDLFFLLSISIYLFPLFCNGFYDRYLIPVLPIVIAVLTSRVSRANYQRAIVFQVMSWVGLLILGAFSVLGTKEYLAWNQARWDAVNYLTEERKISVHEIDGGFEFNGLNNYTDDYAVKNGKSWWWVDGDKFKIGFGGQPGYRIIKEFDYKKYLQQGTGRICVLEVIS